MSVLLRLLPLLVVGCLLLQSLQPANAVNEEEHCDQTIEGDDEAEYYAKYFTRPKRPRQGKLEVISWTKDRVCECRATMNHYK